MNVAARADGPRPLWAAPIVHVALAATVGFVLDRYRPLPAPFLVVCAAAALASYLILRRSRDKRLAFFFALVTVAALAAWYAQYRRELVSRAELAHVATIDGVPVC